MNPVLESLVRISENQPLPAAHTSSHWQAFGTQTVVQRRGETLVLKAAGFSGHSRASRIGSLLCGLERVCYLPVTVGLKSWPRVWKETGRLAKDLRVSLTRHEWACAVVLSILRDHWTRYGLQPRRIALIGDGDGFLGALILRCLPESPLSLFSIDLPKALVFQAATFRNAFPNLTLHAALPEEEVTDRPGPGGSRQVTLVHPGCTERIEGTLDCAANVVSMQEMTPLSVNGYFNFLRQRSGPQSHFYCLNKLTSRLPGGEESNFMEYPWQTEDQFFLDEACPYLRFFLDLHAYPNGPRLLGLRLPLVNRFSGVHWHRLARLAPLPR